MATTSILSFASGELAPALRVRADLSKHAMGLAALRNWIVMRHGGVTTRPGTEFIGEVKDSSKAVTFIDFVFNADQTYELEFGDQYMRVIRNGAYQTLTAQDITAVTNANPMVFTYSGADTYANGDEFVCAGFAGDLGKYLNGRNFKVAGVNTAANTFQVHYLDGTNVNSTTWPAYTSGGTVAEVYTLATPYLEADLPYLDFCQSGDIITIVHEDYAPRELSRTGHTSWSLDVITFDPRMDAPFGIGSSGGPAGSEVHEYVVTCVSYAGIESIQSASTSQTKGTPTATSPITITWTDPGGSDIYDTAQYYNIYKRKAGVYGYLGVAYTTSFADIGYTPDTSDTPPLTTTLSTADGVGAINPKAVALYQQRRYFGGGSSPDVIRGSRTGDYNNYTARSPIQADDSFTFNIVDRRINEVRHLIDLVNALVVFTAGGEHAVLGDSQGVLTPTDINQKQQSGNGASTLKPLLVGDSALYVQARGSIVRDIGFTYEVDGYRGDDMTVFATHLFEGYTLVDWAYQSTPHSIVWAVRSDGILLGLTYIKEQQIIAWHRHDFGDGIVENVACIPESGDDAVYVVVRRTINGASKRYVERLSNRFFTDIKDAITMDSAITYDGRNTASTTMTLSGGTDWLNTETLTLTASAAFFTASEVGNEIHFEDADGEIIRFSIDAYTSTTVVTGKANKTVPASLRSTATTSWTRAVDEINGLWHLEGENVAVMADGFVVASPNNPQYAAKTIANGTLSLSRCYGVVNIGLPYTCDMKTLDIDTATSETLADKRMLVGKVTVHVEQTRGLWVGPDEPSDDTVDPLENLTEIKPDVIADPNGPVALVDGKMDVITQTNWNSNGRLFIRQIDPVPATVLAVKPAGRFPPTGGQ